MSREFGQPGLQPSEIIGSFTAGPPASLSLRRIQLSRVGFRCRRRRMARKPLRPWSPLKWQSTSLRLVPPPLAAKPLVAAVYRKVVVVGTLVMVNVPLYPATPTPEITTVCPATNPCAAVVVMVTVVPASVAPTGEPAMVADFPAKLTLNSSPWLLPPCGPQ